MIKGSKMSEISKEKISDKLKGKIPKNFEDCIKPNQFKAEHYVLDDWKEKIREKNKGNLYNYKNGKFIDKKERYGYIYIYSPNHPKTERKNNNYVQEHILVVEKFIGRFLTEKEVVHHINRNPKDNRIENLMLFPNNSKHLKFHQKVRQFGFTNPILKEINERWNNYKEF